MLQRPIIVGLNAVFLLLTSSACSWLSKRDSLQLADDVPGLEPQRPGRTQVPDTALPQPTAGADRIRLSSSSYIPVRYINQRAFIPVEGLVADGGFSRVQANAALLGFAGAEKHAQLNAFLEQIVRKVGRTVTLHDPFIAADIGYFSAWIPASEFSLLKDVEGLPMDVRVAPVVRSEQQPHNLSGALLPPNPPLSHQEMADYSGIERLGVSAFLAKVKSELGEEPTGSRVNVGVTDTGVTYAHPAFRDRKNSKSRIKYMKDFTNEGIGFVSPDAKITVTRIDRGARTNRTKVVAVSLTAEFLAPGAVERFERDNLAQLPFSNLSDEVFLLPEKLVELLESPVSQVRMGVISETSFATRDEKVDLNGNGKNDDSFYFFHSPKIDGAAEKVWIDFSGTGNFKNSKALRDFNVSGDVQEVLSEQIGLAFAPVEIRPVQVDAGSIYLTRVSLVGFDPGNHGTHVTGIIGASKTLSNDRDGTLARGVSPEANLMVNRVCANNSGCSATRAIIDLAQNGAQIINMSLGGLGPDNDGYGIQETVINRLTELYNVLFIISAGNSGPGRQTVGSPSTARHALSVAATATANMIRRQYNWPGVGINPDANATGDEDFVMFFSSRGPSAAGGFKPNVAAPGTQLSAVQLNAARGFRAGTDVYWGTSMAAPAAAGAAALLLDAAIAFNEKNPNQPLPTDALTLRRVLLDSARAFNVSSFNPATGEVRKGVYTWIDQGYGMISLPDAWDLLKKKAQKNLATGVVSSGKDKVAANVPLNYGIRVLRPMGNGKKYDGSASFKTGTLLGEETTERKFGQGIWLNENEADALVEVQFTRQLPLASLSQANVGDLLRQLNTSAESFALEAVYYGGQVDWLKVGVPQDVACEESADAGSNALTLIGAGAIENPADEPGAGLTPLRASSLFLCLKKKEMAKLLPGDHGAIIRAYRVVDGVKDATASFEIPIYLVVPHHAVGLQAKFSSQKIARSFTVDRHYVRIPQGVGVLRVALEVPSVSEGGKPLCASASLMVLKGSNTATPAELVGLGGVAQSCNSLGAPLATPKIARFTELNPEPGIWDLHVFGRFQFPISPYKLEVDYATFAEVAPLNLTPATIASGTFNLTIQESTFDAVPDASKSKIRLSSLVGRTKHEILKDAGWTVIPSAAGVLARTYSEDEGLVTITTSSIVSGLDIDLMVDECEDVELKNCKQVDGSGNAAAEEQVVFFPKAGKYYAVRVDPYEVPGASAAFSATENIQVSATESGALKVVTQESNAKSFQIDFAFDPTKIGLLQKPTFKSGQYEIMGDCRLANAAGLSLVNVPIHVLAQ